MKALKRIRDWMPIPGHFHPGTLNAITDVPGVLVGQCTLDEGTRLHTGVTVIKPHSGDTYRYPTPCAVYVANGYGKLTGSVQVDELGELESLIGLTNTLSVAQVVQGILDYQAPRMNPNDMSMNVLVGETNDWFLSDIRSFAVRPEHVAQAIANLSSNVEEGCVGAGNGTYCYGWKGGIGTSSRAISKARLGETINAAEPEAYHVGALVQTNFGGNLHIYGHAVAEQAEQPKDKGSCMIVIATDAPLDARQLKRVSKRGIVGMTNTGSYIGGQSGDFCIAFANYAGNLRERGAHVGSNRYTLAEDQLNPIFEAVAEAVQEAVYNSLTMAHDTFGVDGHVALGLNPDDIVSLRGVLY